MRLVKTQVRPSGGCRARMLCIVALAGLYSIVGTMGMPAFAQQPLPTPAPLMTFAPVTTTDLLPIAPATPAAPPAGACVCDRALYTCSSFSNWSAAQTCFNQCRIAVGYDIHGLDEDGDGVACEMAMEGASPFTLPVLPTPVTPPTPPLIQETVTATMPLLPTPLPALSIPAVTAVVTPLTPMTSLPATVTELPADPAETVAGTEETPAPRSPTMALPWVILTAAVAAAAGALIWLRRRG